MPTNEPLAEAEMEVGAAKSLDVQGEASSQTAESSKSNMILCGLCCLLAIGGLVFVAMTGNSEIGDVDLKGDLKGVHTCIWTAGTCQGLKDRKDQDLAVLLIHGFGQSKETWEPLMKRLWQNSFCAVACDMTGYHPESPENVSKYGYDLLAQEAFRQAKAVEFNKFAVVGHGEGAGIGWVMASGLSSDAGLITSFSALGVPHLDVWSSLLQGPEADIEQQAAAQWLGIYMLPNAATLHSNRLYDEWKGGFENVAEMTRGLHWYNGMIDYGVMALPPKLSKEELVEFGFTDMAELRDVFSPQLNDIMGPKPQSKSLGLISVPTLFACGHEDERILCNNETTGKTDHMISTNSTLEIVDTCGSDLISADCQNVSYVERAVISHIRAFSATRKEMDEQ